MISTRGLCSCRTLISSPYFCGGFITLSRNVDSSSALECSWEALTHIILSMERGEDEETVSDAESVQSEDDKMAADAEAGRSEDERMAVDTESVEAEDNQMALDSEASKNEDDG
jgi:hypothetical protein